MALVLAIQHWRYVSWGGASWFVLTIAVCAISSTKKLLHLHNNFGWPNFWVMISWSNTKLGLLILLLTHYLDRRRRVPSWPYLVCLVWRRSNPIWGGAGPFLLSIIKELHCDPNAHLHCILLGGHLYDKGLLVISEASTWISKLLQEFHSNPTGRHSGAFHTYRRLAATLYWRNMMRSAQQYLAACFLSASTIWGCFSHRQFQIWFGKI